MLSVLSCVSCPAYLDTAKELYLEPHCYIEDFWVRDKSFCGHERANACWLSYLYGEVITSERFDRNTTSGWQSIYKERNKKIQELESAITELTEERDALKRKCGRLRTLMDNLPDLIAEAASNLINRKMEGEGK